MRKDIVEKIKELSKNEDTRQVMSELKSLKEDFYNVARIEAEKQLEKFLEEGGIRADFERPKDEVDAQFKELVSKLNERIKSFREKEKKDQLKNFDEKNELLKEVEKLREEEHIGKALARMKLIQEEWKKIGPVPREKAKTLSSEYSQKLDEFYYGIKIYSELQDHDFKKNIELRKAIIEKIKALKDEKSIKELQILLPAYQADWDQQGPVYRNDWEGLRNEYWEAVRAVQDRINEHYKKLRDNQQENLKKKQSIISELDQILSRTDKLEKVSKWDKATRHVIDLQKNWKTAGFAGKQANDKIWKEFRKKCDEFFQKKEAYFSELKDELKDVRAKKEQLIKKVSELKDNTNWKETSQKIQKIQKDWQRSGALIRGEEQKMWKRFRSECDHFFKKKKEWYDTLDDRKAENLKKKKAFLKELKKFKTEAKENEAKEQLTAEFKKFYDLGPVPNGAISELMKEFREIQKSLLKKAGLEGEDLQELQYKVKVERLGEKDNPADALQKERKELERQIKQLDSEKNQYENNLGFFQHVDDSNPMKKEVMDKISKLDERRSGIIDRIKLIKSELRKLKQEEIK